MKKNEIKIGGEYAYQRNRNGNSLYDIERATVTKFTESYGGAPMVEIEIKRKRWDYDLDENWNKVTGSEREVEYLDIKKVPLSTIIGEYETEHARIVAEGIKRSEQREEERRLSQIHNQWKKDVYDPAMKELITELSHITRKGYITERTELQNFDLEQIKAITEALRKVMVEA